MHAPLMPAHARSLQDRLGLGRLLPASAPLMPGPAPKACRFAAEEAIFYPALLQAGIAGRRQGGVEDETLDAIHDHNDIRDAVAEVARHPVGGDAWYAAVAAANQANSDHMAEEEREGLTDFRRLAALQRRHDLAVAFAAWEARNVAGVQPVDKDPAAYVSQAEKSAGYPGDGSLRIGGLQRARQGVTG
jgi:hypothetical protein